MDALYLGLTFLRMALATAFSRVLRGPARPSWSFLYEVLTRTQKRFGERLALRPPVALRAAYDAIGRPSREWKRARIERAELGGVPVLYVESGAIDPAAPTLLYFHGGAFIFGSERTHGDLLARLSRLLRARVVFPLYRLAPEHPFPAALEDARAVYDALLRTGVGSKRVAVLGDSAGGNLAVGLAIALRDSGAARPSALVAICPWLDLAAKGGSMSANAPFDWGSEPEFQRWADTYLAGADPRLAAASPVYAALQDLPPTLALVGGAEMLLDQVVTFAERAKAAGSDVTLHVAPDLAHDWVLLADQFPAFQADFERIASFVRLHAKLA